MDLRWSVAVLTLCIGTTPAAADVVPRVPRAYPDLGTVNAVAQTPDGYLWLGTRAGLVRFDGLETFRFDEREVPELRSGGVRRLLAARDGSLWMAIGDGVLSYSMPGAPPLSSDRRGEAALVQLRDGRFRRLTRADGLPDDWVWSIAEAPDGTVWLGTERGLARIAPGAARAEAVPCDGVPEGQVVSAVHADAAGAVWLLTRKGLFVLRGGACAPGGVDAPGVAIAPGRPGQLFVGTREGLHELIDGRAVRRLGHEDGILGDSVYAVALDRGGDLWVGAASGATRLGPGDGWRVRSKHRSSMVLALAQDREGSVWIGTLASGAIQVRRTPVQHLGAADGIPGTAFSVLAARDGAVWATTTGGLSRVMNGEVTSYGYRRELPTSQARSMAEAADGTLWIAAASEGLIEWRGDRVRTLHALTAELRVRRAVRSVTVARDGALWVAWDDGALTRYPDGRPGEEPATARTYTPADGLCGIEILAMADAPDGTMWVGTRRGLASVRGDSVRCRTDADGLPSNDVVAVTVDGDGTVWVGSRTDAGLARVRDGRVQVVRPAQGLPRGGIFRILDDGRGHLWWSSARGVHRVSRREVDAVLDGRAPRLGALTFDRADGLGSDEMIAAFDPAGTRSADGRLWWPSPHGLAVVTDPDAAGPLTVTAPIVQAVRSGGRWLGDPMSGALTADAGATYLEVRYTAPTFLLPHRLRFEHRLDGVDRDWIAADARRTAFYGNLRPGSFTFRVRAYDERHRLIPQEARVAVTIPPMFFQTWWFRAAAIAAALLSGIAIQRARVRRRRERQALVHAERARIARDLHDHLGQGLGAIGFLADALHLSDRSDAVKGQELVDRLRRAVGQTRKGVDELIWDLRAATDETPDLVRALRALVERAADQGATVRLRVPDAPLRAPGLYLHEIPFVVQEAITNAIRHGRARTVDVEVAVDAAARRLRIAVTDDGVGLGAAGEGGGGFGIVGMRERARRLGGELTVGPAQPAGTRVALDLPLAG